MKKIFVSLILSLLIFTPLFSQVDKIKKKSDEHKKVQSENSENSYDSENSPVADGCTQACGEYCFDFFFSSLVKHAKYLSTNKEIYPNLFSLQVDADAGIFPSNDLYLFHLSMELNWSVIGFRGDKYRLFQPEPAGLSIFDAYTISMLLNFGLMDGTSLQFVIGAFVDPNIEDGFPQTGAQFTWFSKNRSNSFVLKYNQTFGSDYNNKTLSSVFIDGSFDYRKRLFKVWHYGVYGVFGFNFQKYYGENVYLFNLGINTMLY